MRGVLLDPRSGRPVPSFADRIGESHLDVAQELMRAPANVRAALERSAELAGPFEPRGSLNTWQETLFSSIATETALTAAAQAYLFPLYYGAIPANYLQPHRTLHLRVFGQLSTAATPGTFTETLKLQLPGDAATAGTTAAASAATTMAASQTNVTWRAEYYIICRADGTSGSILGGGIFESAGVPTTNQFLVPASAPAAVTVDTTVARNVGLTHTPSVATASIAGFHYLLASLN